MKNFVFAVAAIAAITAPVAAQDMDGMDHEGEMGSSPMSEIYPLQEQFMGWVLAAAEQMPEADYGFKPTEDVRSFGSLIGHVAGANFNFCSNALGVDNPTGNMNAEEMTSKAELVMFTKHAIEFCKTAYAMPHKNAHDERTQFGRTGSLTWLLAWNMTHNAEHYGNLVTYYRLKGMVPPSSQ